MMARFKSWGTPPTPHQREIATILIEECAEVQQRATKLLRFGGDEIQPGHTLTNTERLSAEVGDLLEMVDRGLLAGILTQAAIDGGREHKRKQLSVFLQTDPPYAEPEAARLLIEDLQIQFGGALRSVRLGHFASARAQLNGAAMLLHDAETPKP